MVYWVFSLSHRPIDQVLTGKIPMALAEADRGNNAPPKALYGGYNIVEVKERRASYVPRYAHV